MGYYLDIAKSVPREEPESSENLIKPESVNACRLSEAGWKPKKSFGGVVIWERPDNGFYVSEEIALRMLDRWKDSLQSRGNDEGVTQH